MWMGELITDRGVGNGMSVLIFTTVISVIPGEILAIYRDKSAFYAAVAIVVVIAIVAFIVFMEQAQRRIPVQYAKRMVGRRMYGGTSTYIPMKVNQAGVIPVIFASSLLYIPTLAAQLFGNQSNPQGWVGWISRYVEQSNSPFYMLAFFVLIVGFTYFYVSITFNPTEVADNMKKYGGFIPGIRPGTADRRVPPVRAQQAYRAGLGLPRDNRAVPAGGAQRRRRRQPVPVQRGQPADHGRRRAGHGEADREPVAAAQL